MPCVPQRVLLLFVWVLQLINVLFLLLSFLSKGEKSLRDEDKLESFNVKDGGRLYLKDFAW